MAALTSTPPSPAPWSPQPAAAALVETWINALRHEIPRLNQLAQRMENETGTTLGDWVDHLVLRASQVSWSELERLGFQRDPHENDVARNQAGMFPAIRILEDGADEPTGLAIGVESVEAFAKVHLADEQAAMEGEPGAAMRKVCLERTPSGAAAWAVERHGSPRIRAALLDASAQGDARDASAHLAACRQVEELFRSRPRAGDDPIEGFLAAQQRIAEAKELVGAGRACDIFFAVERDYWQQRNRAAQIQKARQDRLGLGWANHDHHTYRSSRWCFPHLIACLEQLGFECRERFYAGLEAGWGAQVLEHPEAGIVVFADVDLAPEEVAGDFPHQVLSARDTLGTVGLWCALHGESFLEAGMHHLECQFDFDLARQQLEAEGIGIMPPFTDLPYLKQAFTEAEVWLVDPKRLETCVARGWIDRETADRFAREGARGSHLEILQRRAGYKGFNQAGISDIIRRTDPRRGEARG